MNQYQFVEKLKVIEQTYTCYLYGGIGERITNTTIDSFAKRYPVWYTKERISKLKEVTKETGKLYRGFDCSGLIKSVIWGFPDVKYASNNLPDVNAYTIANSYCFDRSNNFDNIDFGEILYMDGHVGVYIGDKKVIESAPSINGVNITNLNYQKWKSHGKLKCLNWVDLPQSYTYYTVKAGDNLTKIANKHNMTLKEISQLNPEIKNLDLIYVNQKIKIKGE